MTQYQKWLDSNIKVEFKDGNTIISNLQPTLDQLMIDIKTFEDLLCYQFYGRIGKIEGDCITYSQVYKESLIHKLIDQIFIEKQKIILHINVDQTFIIIKNLNDYTHLYHDNLMDQIIKEIYGDIGTRVMHGCIFLPLNTDLIPISKFILKEYLLFKVKWERDCY